MLIDAQENGTREWSSAHSAKGKNDVQKWRSKPTNITNYHKSEDKILIAFLNTKKITKEWWKMALTRGDEIQIHQENDDHNDDHHDNTGNDQDTTGTAAATGVAGDQPQPQGWTE